MDLDLKGKVAVITGGSVGIGLAVAEALAAEGVNLVLVARQSERLKQEATRIAEGFGVRAIGVAADVAKAEGIDAVVSAVEREFGGRTFSSTMPARVQTRRLWRPQTRSGSFTGTST